MTPCLGASIGVLVSGMALRVARLLQRRLTSLMPWTGHHIKHVPQGRDALLLPWGFLSQQAVKELVQPARRELLKPRDSSHDEESMEESHGRRLLHAMRSDLEEGSRQAYFRVAQLYSDGCDFVLHDVTSPCLSNFIMDVMQSYHDKNMQPQLIVHDCEASLTSLRMERGFVNRNSYLLGLMGTREAMYEIMCGAIGPEQALLAERNGEGPRRLIAEVEYKVDEEFSLLERDTGRVLLSTPRSVATHYFTFESDYFLQEDGHEELDWCVTNINDVVKPALSARLPPDGPQASRG